MRLPARLLSPVGRRRGRALTAVVVVLAGAAVAMGMSAASSRSPRTATSPPPAAAPDGPSPIASAIALRRWRAGHARPRAHRGGAAYYRRTARRHVPAGAAASFLPLYRAASRRYGVNWRLLASIHRQETGFSTHPRTYRGLNAFGCCAGPMQFNVTNGPVSTWKLYRQAFRTARRPRRYPHRSRSHPSVYDDFDAIMAAAWLLSDSGAGDLLDLGAWSAAYAYYGHDRFGVTYADQVLARAVAWQRGGFCLNCPLDEALVAELEDAYGAAERRRLIAAERRRKNGQRRRRRGRARDERDRKRRHGDRKRGDATRAPRPPAGRGRRPAAHDGTATDPPPATATAQPSTTPTATAPAPAAHECSPVGKLLGGCRGPL